jgi:subtilisin family serine protease
VIACALALASLLATGTSGASNATPAKHSAPAGRYIVVLRDAVSSPEQTAHGQARTYGAVVDHVYSHALKGYSATVHADRVDALRADPNVEDVVKDETFGAASASCPICSVNQITARGARRIGADQSSTHSGDGTGDVHVKIAILDSGIQPDQPDLNVVGGVDCGRGNGWADVNGHGTIVAGVAAARDNAIGIVGVAPGASLWSVRVLDKSLVGSTSNVLCGIDWVTATRTDADPTNDIQVANMSLGATYAGPHHDDEHCGAQDRDVVHQAICRSTAAGITYVAAAGNSTADLGRFFPATYPEMLTMTAISDSDGAPGSAGGPNPCDGSPDDSPASFSNFATLAVDQAHTLAAPGVCISSTYIGSDVAVDSGTSFASPFGTGTVALCIANGACAGLSPAQIVNKIVGDTTAYNLANPGYGFAGDPAHPIAGRYYGYLLRAALY